MYGVRQIKVALGVSDYDSLQPAGPEPHKSPVLITYRETKPLSCRLGPNLSSSSASSVLKSPGGWTVECGCALAKTRATGWLLREDLRRGPNQYELGKQGVVMEKKGKVRRDDGGAQRKQERSKHDVQFSTEEQTRQVVRERENVGTRAVPRECPQGQAKLSKYCIAENRDTKHWIGENGGHHACNFVLNSFDIPFRFECPPTPSAVALIRRFLLFKPDVFQETSLPIDI